MRPEWGVSSREGSIKRKEKRDLAQRVEQTPLDPCFDLTQKKKSPKFAVILLVCAREFYSQSISLALMQAGCQGSHSSGFAVHSMHPFKRVSLILSPAPVGD